MSSLLDSIIRALAEEETKQALDTGRGKHGVENVGKRVGVCMGLKRAQEIVMETAKKFNTEDELDPKT